MSEVNSEKPKVTRRSSLKCRRINAKPNPAPVGAVKKNGKRSSISWGQIDTFEFKEMKPKFQENTEINKEKTKEEEERHKKFLETRRRSISNEFISEKDMMKACINFIEEIFDEEKNKSKKKELEKINETQESYSSSKNEEVNNKKSKNVKREESSSSSDSSSSESSCNSPNCSFRREFNRKNNESKKDKESDKKIEKKVLKSPKFEKKKENNKTLKFKMKEKEDLEDTEKEKEEKIVIKKNKNVEKKNEGKKVLKEKIIKKEERNENKKEKDKEKQKKDDNENKEEELQKRKEEPENKIKKEQKGKIMSEFRASNKVRLISYKEARELDLDTVAYIVLTDGSVLVVRKEYGNKKQNIIKKKMNNKPITNLSKRIINKNFQTMDNNNNNGNIPPQIQMNEIQLPNFKKIILQNEFQEQPIPSIYPKQNFNFNTQIFPNNNISFLAQNYKKNFKKINNNLSLKLNKMSISPSLKMDRDKKTFNYFSPKNMAKKRYINHNYAQSLKNISQSNNHPQFRKFIKISPQREVTSNRYTIINAIPFYDDNSNQILDNSSQVNPESVLFPDLGDSETNLSLYNRYKTMKQPNFIYSPIKSNFNEDNYNSIDQLNI